MTIKLITFQMPFGRDEIHKAGCGDIEKAMKRSRYAFDVQDVEATSLDELAQHYADDEKANTDEDAPAWAFKDRLLAELKPCTGLRK
tara:strand:- start:61 stop:321 length:261 start_codon:yes stop_codon:yes gene_type:complete